MVLDPADRINIEYFSGNGDVMQIEMNGDSWSSSFLTASRVGELSRLFNSDAIFAYPYLIIWVAT